MNLESRIYFLHLGFDTGFGNENRFKNGGREMVIGICQLDLRIPENHSLKGKRHVLRKLIDRVRHRFNVAISEVGDNDLWQRAQIGFCTVGNDRRHINSSLDKIVDFIEQMHLAEMVHTEIEIITI